MFKAQCHCKNITLITKNIPTSLTSCNCSICNRYGALWAYYNAEDVEIRISDAPTSAYLWDKKEIKFHHCSKCGCATHYTSVGIDGQKLTVINTRMAELKEMENIPVKKFDGADTWKFVTN